MRQTYPEPLTLDGNGWPGKFVGMSKEAFRSPAYGGGAVPVRCEE
jgi:hypothetical protein